MKTCYAFQAWSQCTMRYQSLKGTDGYELIRAVEDTTCDALLSQLLDEDDHVYSEVVNGVLTYYTINGRIAAVKGDAMADLGDSSIIVYSSDEIMDDDAHLLAALSQSGY